MVQPSSAEMRQAFRTYHSLDPQTLADPDELFELADVIDNPEQPTGQRGAYRNVAANINLELGVHPALMPREQNRHLGHAAALLTARDEFGAYLIDHTNEADTFRVHLPVLTYGNLGFARKRTYHNLAKRMKRFADTSNPDFFKYKGVLFEHKTAMLLGYTALPGINVAPSLERQNRNDILVPDEEGRLMPYRWDLTIWSDGREIDEGEYRAQIKNQGDGNYHPDIAMIYATGLGIQPRQPEKLVEACRTLIQVGYGRKLPTELQESRDIMLAELDRVGPVKKSTDASRTPSLGLQHRPFLDLRAS